MNVLLALVVGALVGSLAGRLLGRVDGLLSNAAIGSLGSVIGGFLSMVIRGTRQTYLTFSWPSIFWSCIGALLFVAIITAVQGYPHHSSG